MFDFPADLYPKQPAIVVAGWLHVALALLMLAGLAFDQREILGLNPWIKPLKFATSVAIYLFTIALFASYLPASRWLSVAGWIIAVAITLEILLISLQALRGTSSHFNTATPFDAAVFGIMGTAIVVNSLVVAALLVQYFVTPTSLSAPYLWGIRLGLFVFLVASFQGFLMVSLGAHTVGAPDGGSGLPFVNWSTSHGDLRIAHFVGLHALQVVPLAGYLMGRGLKPGSGGTAGVLVVFTLAGLLAGTMVWTLLRALAGRPLIDV